MSAFLGPIHYMLFSKIKFQDDFCEFLIEKANLKKDGFKLEVEENTYVIPNEDLSEIVDLNNIHMSLQEMIGEIEYKLVYIVKKIESENIFSFDDILNFANEYGKLVSKNEFNNAFAINEVYNFLSSKLLNGMPCDRVQEIISNDNDLIAWRDRVDIHEIFWSNLDRSSREFYKIREQIILGILENSDFKFEEIRDFEYVLRRK